MLQIPVLINSVEQTASWEVAQLDINFHVLYETWYPPLDFILSRLNPVHALTT
jgi:hypothetical protein